MLHCKYGWPKLTFILSSNKHNLRSRSLMIFLKIILLKKTVKAFEMWPIFLSHSHVEIFMHVILRNYCQAKIHYSQEFFRNFVVIFNSLWLSEKWSQNSGKNILKLKASSFGYQKFFCSWPLLRNHKKAAKEKFSKFIFSSSGNYYFCLPIYDPCNNLKKLINSFYS